MSQTARTTGRSRLLMPGAVGLGMLLALAYAVGVLPFPDLGDALSDLPDSLGAWTYLLIPALAFLETAAFIGLPVPGETAVLIGGVVAERGEVSLAVLIGLVWVAAFAGDTVSFLLGRKLGRPSLREHGAKVRIRPEHVDRVEAFFERHGGQAIVIGRFVRILRALTPFVAGTSGLSLRRFVAYSASGSLTWAATITTLGYVFADSLTAAGDIVTRVTVAVLVLLVGLAWAKRSGRLPRRPRQRAARERQRSDSPRAPGRSRARALARQAPR